MVQKDVKKITKIKVLKIFKVALLKVKKEGNFENDGTPDEQKDSEVSVEVDFNFQEMNEQEEDVNTYRST